METTILVILAIVGVVIAMLSVMKPIMDDEKVRGKVLNFSEGMRDYYFLLSGSRAQTEEALAGPMEGTAVAYSYLPEEESVRFRKENVEADYRLRFFESGGKTYLRVSRVAEEREKGNIPYLVNAFFIKDLQAKPVDCRQFEALFPENGDGRPE